MTALAKPGWDRDRRARELMARRDQLVRALPKRYFATRTMAREMHEQIVDDAIAWTAIEYQPAIHNADELIRVYWSGAKTRAQRAADGRHDIVRAGNERVDLAALEEVSDSDTPERVFLERAETRVAVQFAALLEGDARHVFSIQWRWNGRRKLGTDRIVKQTGMPLNRVRSAEAVIEFELRRFTRIYTAGRLCGFLGPAISALAAGEHDNKLEEAARVHLEVVRCPVCRADYTRQLRYLRSAQFSTKVAQLLPAPVLVEHERRRTGVRDLIADWVARLLGHDPVIVPQLTGAGRGLTGALGIKLAVFCASGALCVCVGTVLPVRTRPAQQTPRVTATPTPRLQRARATSTPTPTAAATATPTPTATLSATPRPKTKRHKSTKTQGGTGPRDHEQTPASPAPANAAPNGASEFDPSYQPSQPAPAPVPAAPGSSEFF